MAAAGRNQSIMMFETTIAGSLPKPAKPYWTRRRNGARTVRAGPDAGSSV
jgi:hypothetical protein